MKPRHELKLADLAVEHYRAAPPSDIPSPLSKTTYAYACATGALQNVISEVTFCAERAKPRLDEALTKLTELMSRLEHSADEDTWKLLEQIEERVRFAGYDATNMLSAFDRAVARVSPPARTRLTPPSDDRQQTLLVA